MIFEFDIRKNYEQYGIIEYYKNVKNYYNPHSIDIEKSILNIYKNNQNYFNGKILDLSSGNGLITTILKKLNINNVIGCEPYLYEEYIEQTKKYCLRYSFEDIQKGKMLNYKYDTIICSYALHLAENSLLAEIILNLSLICNYFIILSPNNKPIIKDEYGFSIIEYNKIGKCKYHILKSLN